MLLLHLDAGSGDEAPIWTWRLANLISAAISSESLPVVLCIVTSPTTAILAVGTDEDGELNRGSPFAMERATILSKIKSAAVKTDSYLKLEPLTLLAQHSYALQVLRAKYSYSGTLDGIPSSLLDFVVSRSGGKPVFIEQMLEVLDEQSLLTFTFDEEGVLDTGAEIVRDVPLEVLQEVPTPHNIRSEFLQLFESLDPALQAALRLAAPMEAFSEAMLAHVGLPSRIVGRLVHLFNMAVDEGILEAYSRAIPKEVLAADPTAATAWAWRMDFVQQEVLQATLASEVQRVERQIAQLRLFHRTRSSKGQFHGHPPASALALSEVSRGLRRGNTRTLLLEKTQDVSVQCELGVQRSACCTIC